MDVHLSGELNRTGGSPALQQRLDGMDPLEAGTVGTKSDGGQGQQPVPHRRGLLTQFVLRQQYTFRFDDGERTVKLGAALVQVLGVLGQNRRRPVQGFSDSGPEFLLQEGQHLGPDLGARERRIGIGWIVPRIQSLGLADAFRVRPAQPKERAQVMSAL